VDVSRPSLWSWDAPHFVTPYAIATGGFWVVAGARAVDLVVGRDRVAAAVMLCLPVALVMTVLAVGYVLRPVEHPVDPEATSPDTGVRDESERRAWRSR
jgi:hypothetical protein